MLEAEYSQVSSGFNRPLRRHAGPASRAAPATTGGRRHVSTPHTAVTGTEFDTVLAAAKDGDEDAFAVLWRDLNPALLRYLRVVAPGAAEALASEIWLEGV